MWKPIVSKKSRRVAAAALIFCGIGVAGVLAWKAYWADDLLANATPITSVKTWMLSLPESNPAGHLPSGGGSYVWTSDRQILYFHDFTATDETDPITGRRVG